MWYVRIGRILHKYVHLLLSDSQELLNNNKWLDVT